jgi:ABC-type nickel/cobalt efflux system permease component RcnA
VRGMRRSITTGLQLGIVAVAILLAGAWFIVVDAGSHSASDTLRPWLVGVAVIVLIGGGLVIALGRPSGRRRR